MGAAAPVNIDTWTGSTLSQTSTAPSAFLISGSQVNINMSGTQLTDMVLSATQSMVSCDGCLTESMALFGGGPVTVTGAHSLVTLRNCYHQGAPISGNGIVWEGPPIDIMNSTDMSVSSSIASQRRWWLATKRTLSYGSDGFSIGQDTLAKGSINSVGSLSNVASTIVADGVVLKACAQWVIPFTATNQYMQIASTSSWTTPAQASWCAVMIDVKVTSGNPIFYLWNQGTVQIALPIVLPTDNQWHTIAVMFYSPGSQGFFFDCSSADGAAVTYRASAIQARAWNSTNSSAPKADAIAWLRRGVYSDPSTTASSSTTSTSPTGTTSASSVMMGLGLIATPIRSGNMLITGSGQMANATANDGATVQLYYGTGSAPVNGAAVSGTAIGVPQTHTSLTAADTDGWSFTVPVLNLTPGTPYWIDVALKAPTGGAGHTATVTGVNLAAVEL